MITNKKQKALGLATLFLLTTGFERVMQDEKPSPWKELIWEQSGFSVELPENSNSPEYLDSELEMPGRAHKVAAHTVVGYDGDVLYMIHYCDLPAGVSESYLEHRRKDIRQKVRKLANYRAISLGPYQGIEYKLRSDHEFGLYRHYVIKQRLFVLVVSNQKQAMAPKNLDRFLDSFKVIQPDK